MRTAGAWFLALFLASCQLVCASDFSYGITQNLLNNWLNANQTMQTDVSVIIQYMDLGTVTLACPSYQGDLWLDQFVQKQSRKLEWMGMNATITQNNTVSIFWTLRLTLPFQPLLKSCNGDGDICISSDPVQMKMVSNVTGRIDLNFTQDDGTVDLNVAGSQGIDEIQLIHCNCNATSQIAQALTNRIAQIHIISIIAPHFQHLFNNLTYELIDSNSPKATVWVDFHVTNVTSRLDSSLTLYGRSATRARRWNTILNAWEYSPTFNYPQQNLSLPNNYTSTFINAGVRYYLLSQFQISKEFADKVLLAMDWAGIFNLSFLQSFWNTTLTEGLDFSNPVLTLTNDISHMSLYQRAVNGSIICHNSTGDTSLLSVTIEDVLEDMALKIDVDNQTLYLQMNSVSLDTARITDFHTLFGISDPSLLKYLAQKALTQGLPSVNSFLKKTYVSYANFPLAVDSVPPVLQSFSNGELQYVSFEESCGCMPNTNPGACQYIYCQPVDEEQEITTTDIIQKDTNQKEIKSKNVNQKEIKPKDVNQEIKSKDVNQEIKSKDTNQKEIKSKDVNQEIKSKDTNEKEINTSPPITSNKLSHSTHSVHNQGPVSDLRIRSPSNDSRPHSSTNRFHLDFRRRHSSFYSQNSSVDARSATAEYRVGHSSLMPGMVGFPLALSIFFSNNQCKLRPGEAVSTQLLFNATCTASKSTYWGDYFIPILNNSFINLKWNCDPLCDQCGSEKRLNIDVCGEEGDKSILISDHTTSNCFLGTSKLQGDVVLMEGSPQCTTINHYLNLGSADGHCYPCNSDIDQGLFCSARKNSNSTFAIRYGCSGCSESTDCLFQGTMGLDMCQQQSMFSLSMQNFTGFVPCASLPISGGGLGDHSELKLWLEIVLPLLIFVVCAGVIGVGVWKYHFRELAERAFELWKYKTRSDYFIGAIGASCLVLIVIEYYLWVSDNPLAAPIEELLSNAGSAFTCPLDKTEATEFVSSPPKLLMLLIVLPALPTVLILIIGGYRFRMPGLSKLIQAGMFVEITLPHAYLPFILWHYGSSLVHFPHCEQPFSKQIVEVLNIVLVSKFLVTLLIPGFISSTLLPILFVAFDLILSYKKFSKSNVLRAAIIISFCVFVFISTSTAAVLQASGVLEADLLFFHLTSVSSTFLVFALADQRIVPALRRLFKGLPRGSIFQRLVIFCFVSLKPAVLFVLYAISQLLLLGLELVALPKQGFVTLVVLPALLTVMVAIGCFVALRRCLVDMGDIIEDMSASDVLRLLGGENSSSTHSSLQQDDSMSLNQVKEGISEGTSLLNPLEGDEYEEEEEEDIHVDLGQPLSYVTAVWTVLKNMWDWLNEVHENQDVAFYGERIKTRRGSYLLGGFGLAAYAIYRTTNLFSLDGWTVLNSWIHSYNKDITVSEGDGAVFSAMVDIYEKTEIRRTPLILLAAIVYWLGIGADVFGRTRRWLIYSRFFTIVGSILVFVYIVLSFQPDYPKALDLQVLSACSSEFCKHTGQAAERSFGAVEMALNMLALVPIYINIPWTLARVAFFLYSPRTNAICTALQWGTYISLSRLLVLPVTMTFLYSPFNSRLLPLFLVLVLGSIAGGALFALSGHLKLNIPLISQAPVMLWYFVWSYPIYMVLWCIFAFFGLGKDPSIVWNLIIDMCKNYEWGATLAEFFLSDVLISDSLFWVYFTNSYKIVQ